MVILIFSDIISFAVTAYYAGLDHAYEAVAPVTAVITAGYSVLQEEAQRPKPLLRATSHIVAGWGLGSVGMVVEMKNIGEAVASNIEGRFRLQNAQNVTLNGNGAFTFPAIAPQETVTARLIDSTATTNVTPASYEGTIGYKDMEGENMPSIELSGSIQSLLDEMTRAIMNER